MVEDLHWCRTGKPNDRTANARGLRPRIVRYSVQRLPLHSYVCVGICRCQRSRVASHNPHSFLHVANDWCTWKLSHRFAWKSARSDAVSSFSHWRQVQKNVSVTLSQQSKNKYASFGVFFWSACMPSLSNLLRATKPWAGFMMTGQKLRERGSHRRLSRCNGHTFN